MPPAIAPASRLRADLDALSDALESATFRFSEDSARQRQRSAVTSLIDDYLIPRLADPEGPLLVAVFGSTGSGKSTLVNSLAGFEVTRPGALRPTTRVAVVLSHRDDLSATQRLRTVGEIEVVTDDHPDLRWYSLVDTPDVDSVIESHREQAVAILARADAVIHVTTPQRYADAVPWEILRDVARRDLPILVVTNRLSRRSGGAVTDLAALLRSEGIGDVARSGDIVGIQEQRLRQHGRLPASSVKRVANHLSDLAESHADVVRRVVRGTIEAVVVDTQRVVADIREQEAEIARLSDAVSVAVSHQTAEVIGQLEQGDLVRSEVVQRWRRLIGVSDLASVVTRGVGRLRDIILPGDAIPPERVDQVGNEAREALIDLSVIRVRRVNEAITTAWRLEPSGAALIPGELSRPLEDREAVGDQIDEWLASLVDLVAQQGQRRFRLARAASVGVNAAATTLLIAIFSATGGITGAEVGVTAGAAAAQQTLLEHIFGGAAANRLADQARRDLAERIAEVIAWEGERFEKALEQIADAADTVEQIESTLASAVDSANEWFDA